MEHKSDGVITVKFDSAKLPPILNALETDNGGQKLVLEVAVCQHVDLNRDIKALTGTTATSGRECRANDCYGW